MAVVYALVKENSHRANRIDDLFDVLSDNRRRATILLLARRDAPIPVERLAEYLATRESEDPSRDDVRKIHISLQHSHLPKLADADIVAYDSQAERVKFAGSRPFESRCQEARSWFDRLADSSPNRSETP